jgi:hypothetical protein
MDTFPVLSHRDARLGRHLLADTGRVGEVAVELPDHRLKNTMPHAAFASLRSPDSKGFYERQRAKGERPNAAIICLAPRRGNVILAMVTARQPDYARHRAPRQVADAA